MSGRFFFILVVGLSLTVVRPTTIHAQTSSGSSIVEQIGCDQTSIVNGVVGVKSHDIEGASCQINDFINLFVYLSKWGMSILALLSTLMLIYGGFSFITAGGRPSKVTEGKNVILGTIVGILVTLTAYIIINTTVTAVSGTTVKSNNPFGPIGSVFKGESPSLTIQGQTKKVPLERPFSGKVSSSKDTDSGIASCRLESNTDWQHNCSATQLQSGCADPASGGNNAVTSVQNALSNKQCDCGVATGTQPDGCFGPQTTKCVRQFQLANLLPPTGVVDNKTKDLIDNGGKNCDDTSNGTQDAKKIEALLPPTQLASAKTHSANDLGCCIVKDGDTDVYCADDVSSRGCTALGSNNDFLAGDPRSSAGGKCTSLPAATGRCGFCMDTLSPSTSTSRCFQNATFHWCKEIAIGRPGVPVSFRQGSCDGSCQTCTHSLKQTP